MLGKPHGRLLQGAQPIAHRLHERGEGVAAIRLQPAIDGVEKRHRRGTALAPQLAADKVHRLHAIGAFIGLVDAGIANELLHAIVADIAVTAPHLHRHVGGIETHVGEERLDHRRHQIGEKPCLLRLRPVRARDAHVQHAPHRERARPFDEGFAMQQHAPHVRMHDQKIGGLVGFLRPGQRMADAALIGIGKSVLIGHFANRDALNAHAQTRHVHHAEHAFHAGG